MKVYDICVITVLYPSVLEKIFIFANVRWAEKNFAPLRNTEMTPLEESVPVTGRIRVEEMHRGSGYGVKHFVVQVHRCSGEKRHEHGASDEDRYQHGRVHQGENCDAGLPGYRPPKYRDRRRSTAIDRRRSCGRSRIVTKIMIFQVYPISRANVFLPELTGAVSGALSSE